MLKTFYFHYSKINFAPQADPGQALFALKPGSGRLYETYDIIA